MASQALDCLPTSPGPSLLVFSSVQHIGLSLVSHFLHYAAPCCWGLDTHQYLCLECSAHSYPHPNIPLHLIHSCSSFSSPLEHSLVRAACPALALCPHGLCSVLYSVVIWLLPIFPTELENLCGQRWICFSLIVVPGTCLYRACHIVGYQ